MCIQDFRIGRWVTTKTVMVPVTAGQDNLLLERDTKRVFFVVSTGEASGITVCEDEVAASGRGILLNTLSISFVNFHIAEYGQWVQKEIHIWPLGTLTVLPVIVGTLPEEILSMSYEELKQL